jgi:hypothetical protein
VSLKNRRQALPRMRPRYRSVKTKRTHSAVEHLALDRRPHEGRRSGQGARKGKTARTQKKPELTPRTFPAGMAVVSPFAFEPLKGEMNLNANYRNLHNFSPYPPIQRKHNVVTMGCNTKQRQRSQPPARSGIRFRNTQNSFFHLKSRLNDSSRSHVRTGTITNPTQEFSFPHGLRS